MKQLYMSIKDLLYYIKFKLTILIYLQPIIIWIIFILLFSLIRLYFYEAFILCDDKRSLVYPVNTIIVSKEATFYGKEILNECHHALKGKQWVTQAEAISKIKETLYNMKNKDKWTTTENLKNLISLVIQFRAVQAINDKDPDYKYLLLIQIAYYITVNGEKESISTLLDTFHNLNINMNKGLSLGRLKIVFTSGIFATNTSIQNIINKTFKSTKIGVPVGHVIAIYTTVNDQHICLGYCTSQASVSIRTSALINEKTIKHFLNDIDWNYYSKTADCSSRNFGYS